MSNKTRVTALIFSIFLIPAFSTLSAEITTRDATTPTEYKLLAPIPLTNPGGKADESTNTSEFITGLFKLGIALATGLAVLMIIYGGIQYMSTDAWNGKEDAKGTITNAIMGLILTISAWVIINTINPKLLNFELQIQKQEITQKTGLVSAKAPVAGNCVGCETLKVDGKTAAQNGCGGTGLCQVSRSLNSKLVNLNKKFPGIYVTEAYPPTRVHQNSCHNVGTCVDVRKVADNRVFSLISAAQLSGLKAVFEVETEARKNAVINASCASGPANCRSTLGEFIAVLPPKILPGGTTKRQISEEHFSIYD